MPGKKNKAKGGLQNFVEAPLLASLPLGTRCWVAAFGDRHCRSAVRHSGLRPASRPHQWIDVTFLFKYLNYIPNKMQSLIRARVKATRSLRTDLLALILIITFITAINVWTTSKLYSGGSRASWLKNEKCSVGSVHFRSENSSATQRKSVYVKFQKSWNKKEIYFCCDCHTVFLHFSLFIIST